MTTAATAAAAAEVFHQAAEVCLTSPLRKGSLLRFPDYGQLVLTGDLHGHRRNFEKLQKYCDLSCFGARHVIVHEVVHEDIVGADLCDTSHEVLLDVARWQCAFPEQVHYLLGNHELAQLTGHEITKNGRVVTTAFEEGVARVYGDGAPILFEAINAYVRALPLAARTANRVFISHSLPGPRSIPQFDPTVLDRNATALDLSNRGSAHALVWGRHHTEEAIHTLADLLDAGFFVCGHQPQETGFDVLHDRMVILASDHNHGVFLPLDLSKPVTIDRLTRSIRPFAGVA